MSEQPSPRPAATSSSRLPHLDWMRGVACVLMFQTHCYDAWLSPAARETRFFMYSQLVGSLPAPLFLFLTGISAALMAQKVSKGGPASSAAGRITRRGLEIWGLAMLFRLQEYLIAFRHNTASLRADYYTDSRKAKVVFAADGRRLARNSATNHAKCATKTYSRLFAAKLTSSAFICVNLRPKKKAAHFAPPL